MDSRSPSREYREKCLSVMGEQCAECGADSGVEVHHINGDPNDNRTSNLIPLCEDCHDNVHAGVAGLEHLTDHLPVDRIYPLGFEWEESKRITFRTPKSTYAAIKSVSEANDVTISEVLRECVRLHLPEAAAGTVEKHDFEEEVEQLANERDDLQKQVVDCRKRVEQLEQENAELRSRINELEERLEETAPDRAFRRSLQEDFADVIGD